MKFLFQFLLSLTICACCATSVCAQFKLAEVPLLTLKDFRAPVPEKAKFPIYFNSRIYYRIDTVIQKKKNRYQVFVRTKIEPRADESYWDTIRIDKKDTTQMLIHEQGHFYLAYICGNNIEKAMPAFNFTANWKEEVKQKFFELLGNGHKTNTKYDEETAHGRNLKQQHKWNKWIREELADQ